MTDPLGPPEPHPTEASPPEAPEPSAAAEVADPPAAPQVDVPARTRFAEPAAPSAPAVEQPVVTDPGLPLVPETPAEVAPAPTLPVVPELSPDLPVVPDEAVAPAAPEAGPALAASPDTGERSGRGLVVTLAVIVALLAGLTGFLGYKAADTRGAGAAQDVRQPALQAVRSAAVLLFSYDYRHLAADFTAGRATTTGKFRGEYDTTTAKLVKDVAPRYKAVVIASVSEASVVSSTPDKVVTLVFLNQQSTSTLTADPKVTQSRLLMTLEHKNGTWLVSDISPR